MRITRNQFQITAGIFIILATLLSACTFSIQSTQSEIPNFDHIVVLENEILSVTEAESVNFKGMKTSSNGENNKALIVEIINGKKVSESMQKKEELAQTLAVQVKAHLYDKSQFNHFIFKFIVAYKNESQWVSVNIPVKDVK